MLRTCASCEWIFDSTKVTDPGSCPLCGFGSYGAHYVYGRAAYRYKLTQKPWRDKQLADFESWLAITIEQTKTITSVNRSYVTEVHLEQQIENDPFTLVHIDTMIAKARRKVYEPCCDNQKRNENGGCDSCGDPCL